MAAKAGSASVESFSLHNMDIHFCDGCDFSKETGVCVIKDDIQMLYPRLLAADAIVLASPIYWFSYSAQLKLCIDRWYAVWDSKHDLFKGKPFGVILIFGNTDLCTSGGVNAIHTLETIRPTPNMTISTVRSGLLTQTRISEPAPTMGWEI